MTGLDTLAITLGGIGLILFAVAVLRLATAAHIDHVHPPALRTAAVLVVAIFLGVGAAVVGTAGR